MNDHHKRPARTLLSITLAWRFQSVASTVMLFALVWWLAFPPLVWADNCWGEQGRFNK